MRERHKTVVDFCANAMRANVGVDVESKIERGGAGRKFFQITGRSEDKNFVREKIELELINEIKRVGVGILQQLADFIYPFIEGAFCSCRGFLVFPVSSITF